MESLVEFITVVRNDRDGLKRTIESLDIAYKKYNFPSNVTHLIIDGDSEDGCVEYVQGLLATRKFKTRLISEPDDGIYDAMNKGATASKAGAVVFLNAGDLLAGDADLNQLVADANAMLAEESIMAVAYSARLKFSARSILIKSREVSKYSPKLPTIHQSILYNCAILLANPYDTSYRICGDYEQFARVFSRGANVVIRGMVLSVFFSGGISSQMPKTLYKESVRVSDKYFNLSMWRSFILRVRLIRSLIIFNILNLAFN